MSEEVKTDNRSLIYDDQFLKKLAANDNYEIAKLDGYTNFEHILNDAYRFRYAIHRDSNPIKSGRLNSEYDQPNYYFFKLFFYFNGSDAAQTIGHNGGLLSRNVSATVWYQTGLNGTSTASQDNVKYNNPYKGEKDFLNSINVVASQHAANTAIDYLLLNYERERAMYLSRFIDILQDININCPWYFQEITGIGELLKREWFSKEDGLDIKSDRKEFTIKMLPDAVDDRIGTMLDLYRAACFSDVLKREVVPANLRKFDMGIFICPWPRIGLNTGLAIDGKNPITGKVETTPMTASLYNSWKTYLPTNEIQVNCKYIELLNCEIDYDSILSAYDTFKVTDAGEGMTYNIKIKCDDVKENRINRFICGQLGDFVKYDIDPIHYETINKLKFEDNDKIHGNFDGPRISDDMPARTTNANAKSWLGVGDFISMGDAAAQQNEQTTKLSLKDILKVSNNKEDGTVLRGWPGSKKEKDGFVANTIKSAITSGVNWLASKAETLLLGNIYKPTTVNKIETGISAFSASNLQTAISRASQLKIKKTSKTELTPKTIGGTARLDQWDVDDNLYEDGTRLDQLEDPHRNIYHD